jgi:hypothetical protein
MAFQRLSWAPQASGQFLRMEFSAISSLRLGDPRFASQVFLTAPAKLGQGPQQRIFQ